MRIGYVGMGAMGRALAARLAPRHDLLVYDIDAQAVTQMESKGAQGAPSLEAMGKACEVVFLCLPKSSNVELVLFGEGGLAPALSSGALIIDQTSGQPGQTRLFAERLARRGMGLLDAPVSGGVPRAEAGEVTIMVSGSERDFSRTSALLGAISCNVFYCGEPVGSAQALKAINNTVNTANRLATLEVAAMGRKLGLSLVALTNAFNNGDAQNFITEHMLTAMIDGQKATDFALALMVKDVDQGFDLASSQSAPMPVSEASRALLCSALRFRGDDARLEAVIPFMERLCGASYLGDCRSRADEVGLSSEAALRLVCTALAACNRQTFTESLALAELMGMRPERIAGAILSGSARSKAAEELLSVEGSAPAEAGDDTSDYAAQRLESLARLARIGARFGVPLFIVNAARSALLTAQADPQANLKSR